MKLSSFLVIVLTFLSIVPLIYSIEQFPLRRVQRKTTFNKVGIFVEGFTEDSVFRTKMTVKIGIEEAEIVELSLEDLKTKLLSNFELFVTPSEGKPGSEDIVKEGMHIISGVVKKGSLLFSQTDSSSPLCREFIYDGVSTTNPVFIYNGICKGPITNVGPMETECRAATASINSKKRGVIFNKLFIHGGFHFEDAQSKEECQVFATITPPWNSRDLIEFRGNQYAEAIIVLCKYGKGAAIMSGVQLDQNASFLKSYLGRNPEKEHVRNVERELSNVSEFSSSLYELLIHLNSTR